MSEFGFYLEDVEFSVLNWTNWPCKQEARMLYITLTSQMGQCNVLANGMLIMVFYTHADQIGLAQLYFQKKVDMVLLYWSKLTQNLSLLLNLPN